MTEVPTDDGLATRWLDSMADIEAESWDRLFSGGNPFLRHAFLSTLEDSGSADAAGGWTPHHLLLERDGSAVAAMPLYLKAHSYGEFVFDWGWAEAWSRHGLAYYPKLLTAVPFCPSVGPRLGLAAGEDPAAMGHGVVARIRKEAEALGLSGWHLLFPDAASLAALRPQGSEAALLLRQDVQFHFHNPGYAHFDDFLAGLRSSRRKNLRKERRRVAAQGVTLERHLGPDIEDADWAAYYRCYVQTFLERSGHTGYLTREFFELLRERMSDQLMLVVARRGGDAESEARGGSEAKGGSEVVAGALFLFDAERLYGRWWGALASVDCLHFETCFYQGIEFAIERGLKVFDPGTQGEHKLLRGFEPVTTRSVHWIRDERFRRAIAAFLEQERAHSQAWGEHAAGWLPYRRDGAETSNTGGGERDGAGGRNTDGSS